MKIRLFLLTVSLLSCKGDKPKPAPPSAAPGEAVPATMPPDSAISAGPMGKSIARGRAILVATRDSLPNNVRNKLSCANCHMDAGTRRTGLTLIGVYARYPQYRARSAGVGTLQARINDCLERSMNGRPISHSSSEMTDLVSYMWFLSRGVPVDGHVTGEGTRKLSATTGDSIRGREIFAANCATCHGAKGEGKTVAPPLWGPDSYNIGAGMARVRTAAGFIRYNMPYDKPGSLSDQQAMDVATYINSQPRPDFAGKENDWPNGGAPPDVPYQTKSSSEECPHTGLWAVCSVEKRLRQSGFVAQKIGSTTKRRPGFSVEPATYTLHKSRLEIYLYRDTRSLELELAKLDTTRISPAGVPAPPGPPPVLIRSGNLAVLLYTDDMAQAERLALAITAGAPQPGSSR